MMWNTFTIINPELIPVIIGGIYLISLGILRELSISKVVLSLLVLLSLAPITPVAYAYVFAGVYIAQALIFMTQKEKVIAYKYFILAFIATATCLDPVLPYYKVVLLTIALTQILFTSEKTEAKSTYLYISNLALLAGLVLKLQPIYDQEFSSLMIILVMFAMCFRVLLLNTTTILTILPIFIMGTIFSESIILISLFTYSIYLAVLIESQKHRLSLFILLLLPFLDFGIFNISFLDVINKNSSLQPLYILLATAILLSLCVAKILETELKKNKLHFNYKTLLISIFPAALIVIKTIETGTASILLPIPLFVAVPIIIVEAKFLPLLSKINLKINLKTPKPIVYSFRWLNTAPKTIHTNRLRRWIRTIAGYISTKISDQDYTMLLAIATFAIVAVVFIYMELL